MMRKLTFDNYDNTYEYADDDMSNSRNNISLFILIATFSCFLFLTSVLFIIYMCFPHLLKKSKINLENLNIKFEIEKYDENIEYSPEICVICLDIFSENQNILKLECNHYFHENCIKEWFGKKTTCPYCKI